MADEKSAADEVAEEADATSSEKMLPQTEEELPSVAEQSALLIDMIDRLYTRLTQPWSAYQLAIILALIAFSYLVYRFYRPRIRAVLGASHGLPKWFLRICAVLNQRLWLMIFVLSSWATVFVMREVTWPSRSYFISLAATLALWWFVVVVTTRLIRSKSVRSLVRWLAGIFMVLTILGLRDTASNALDTVALDLGETRISLLTLLIAGVSLAVLFLAASFLSKGASKRINQIEDMSPSIACC